MSVILHIESATDGCSVAVSDEGQLVFDREDRSSHNSSVALGVLVDEALSLADSRGLKLDAVAVSEGPGSYTGLRIGVSMAKGICYGRRIPMIAVPTLKLLCVSPLLNMELPDDALLCPMIDARRMEVYAALYDRALRPLRPVQPDVVEADTYRRWLDERPVWFFGNGMEKCRTLLEAHPGAHFLPDITPQAQYMAPLAERRLIDGNTADVAYFEPFYLKEFQATKPRNILF